MMEPSRYDLPTGPHQLTPRAASVTASTGADVASSTRAPLRWPETRRKEPPLPASSPSNSSEDDEASDSDGDSECDELRCNWRREHVHTAACDGSELTHPPSGSALPCQPSDQHEDDEVADSLEIHLTAAEMAERASTMFEASQGGPVASGKQVAARTVTKGLVKLAFAVENDRCDQHGRRL